METCPNKSAALEDYLALPYTIEAVRDEDGYCARVVELPGCMTWTDRAEDLWPMVEDAMRAWIGVSFDEGDDVPLPATSTAHVLRFHVEEDLDRALRRRATEEGVSVDQFVTGALSRAKSG